MAWLFSNNKYLSITCAHCSHTNFFFQIPLTGLISAPIQQTININSKTNFRNLCMYGISILLISQKFIPGFFMPWFSTLISRSYWHNMPWVHVVLFSKSWWCNLVCCVVRHHDVKVSMKYSGQQGCYVASHHDVKVWMEFSGQQGCCSCPPEALVGEQNECLCSCLWHLQCGRGRNS